MDTPELESRTAAYARGVAAAEARFGDECRHFDRAIWGMAEVMAAHGRELGEHRIDNPTFGAFVNRWHNPLASATKDCGYARWAKAFPAVASGITDTYAVKKLRSGYFPTQRYDAALPRDWDSDHGKALLANEAAALLDREIKRAFPQLRRNTKRYRELAASKQVLAENMVKETFAAAQVRAAERLHNWYQREEAPFFRDLHRHIAGLTERVLDLQVIDPLGSVVVEYWRYITELRARLNSAEAYTCARLAECGITAPTADQEEACVA